MPGATRPNAMSSYHMESELQDAVSREEIKRLRQKQRETGMSECDYFLEECCCGASRAGNGASSCCPSFLVRCCRCGAGAEAEVAANGGGGNGDADESNGGRDDCAFVQLILYIVFPSFAIVDFLLGAVAKALGWYEQSLGNIVCSNSVTACAVWIALAICGFVLATATVVNALCRCFRPRRSRGGRRGHPGQLRRRSSEKPYTISVDGTVNGGEAASAFSVREAVLTPADVGSAVVTVVVEGPNTGNGNGDDESK